MIHRKYQWQIPPVLTTSLLLICIFLSACSSSPHNYHVALYVDYPKEKSAILAVFPLSNLSLAFQNCQNTAELYRADDTKRGIIDPSTEAPPVYYCLEFEGKV